MPKAFSDIVIAELRMNEAKFRRMAARQQVMVATGATHPARLAASKRRDTYIGWATEFATLAQMAEGSAPQLA